MLLLSTNMIHLLLLFLIISQSIHSQRAGTQSQLRTQLIYLGLSTNDAQGRNRGYNRDMNEARP
jgi:hypothetical protein